MEELRGKQVLIHDGELQRREAANRAYLIKLNRDHLLFNYRLRQIFG